MIYTIGKTFDFAASHQLDQLPEGHKCKRLHGHNYTVEIVLAATQLDANGFVKDYGDLDQVKKLIDEQLDHRHLNDLLSVPTAEILAEWLFNTLILVYPMMQSVTVRETPKTFATVQRAALEVGDDISIAGLVER